MQPLHRSVQYVRSTWLVSGSCQHVAMDVSETFGRELRLASANAGLTQQRLASRAKCSQSEVSRIWRGVVAVDLRFADELARAAGCRLRLTLVPDHGVSLRDSGQLAVAQLIQGQAHAVWRASFERPVGRPPDRRAADLVLEQSAEIVLVEIERWLLDFQAQLRAGQLKRASLAELLGRPVRLVIAVPDLARSRNAVAPHAGIIASALPISSRRAWAAIRSGEPIGGDALLWVRAAR